MYLHRSESGWKAQAPAKLNLYLDVIGRRSDGFHELETVMVPVRLFDSLALSDTPSADVEHGQITLTVRESLGKRPRPQLAVPSGDDNIVTRALRLLQKASGCCRGAHVTLIKRIPVGAGLGGGSSDAAAALALANRAWQLNWSHDRLGRLASEVGSDVPFFLGDGAAICRGRGEQIEPLCFLPKLHFVIASPGQPLSTARVFEALTPQLLRPGGKPDLVMLVDCLRRGLIGATRPLLRNRLETTAARILPAIDRLKDRFSQLDFVGHQLTGSGSAYFGVCRSARHAARIAALLRARMPTWVCSTCSSR